MRVVTYICNTGQAPAGEEAIARIVIPGRDAKGKAVEDWHPVIITAPTAEEADQRARAWWAEQLEAARQRQDGIKARVEKMALARQAKSGAA